MRLASQTPALLMCVLLATAAGAQPRSAALERALAVFGERRLEEALPLFEKAVAESPRDAAALCWLAETRRRLDRLPEAVRDARAALAIDRRSSFAHTILADCYDPVMSGWDAASTESTWAHIQQAVAFDPRNGDAWLSIWKHSVARRDSMQERTALRMLSRIGYFAPAVLAYNRWQLEHLPPRAVLLTQGDMDTYPAAVLQAAAGVRTDVAIVNLSLLNWPDYALAVAAREALPLPDRIGSPEVRRDRYFSDGREPRGVTARVVASWVDSVSRGRFERPLAVAASVSELEQAPALRGRLTYAGPYSEVGRDTLAPAEDLARLRATVSAIDPATFAGSWVSTLDRSPVRRSRTSGLGDLLLGAAARWGEAEVAAGNRPGALAALAKFDSLVAVLGPDDELRPRIDRLRKTAAGR